MSRPAPLSSAAVLLLDLDGTLLHEDVPIPGAVARVQEWVEQGHRICYATNDAVASRRQQRSRLARAGFPTADNHGPTPIVTAASVTAAHLVGLARPRPPLRVLLVGAPAVRDELRGRDVQLTSDRADVVVVGLDTRLTYDRLCQAVSALDEGALFFATNRDAAYLTDSGQRRPGAGAVVAAVEVAAGRPATLLGKPSSRLFEHCLRELGVRQTTHDRVVVVGDSRGDIEAGRLVDALCIRVGEPSDVDPDADLTLPSIADLKDLHLPRPRNRLATPNPQELR